MSENFSLGLVNENFDEWNFTFFSCCIMVKLPKTFLLQIVIVVIIVILWNVFLHSRYYTFTNKHKTTEYELIHMVYFTSSSVLIYYRLLNIKINIKDLYIIVYLI